MSKYYVPRTDHELRRWLKSHYVRRDLGSDSFRSDDPVSADKAHYFCQQHDLPYSPSKQYTVADLARSLGRKYGERSKDSLEAQFFRIVSEARSGMDISDGSSLQSKKEIPEKPQYRQLRLFE